MMTNNYTEFANPWLDQLINADVLETLPLMPPAWIDAVITDPPYFLDKLDNEWTPERTARRVYKKQTVHNLPPGMKFDPAQGRRFYEWYIEVSRELFRVLKPGGFFFSFSSPRLYHRMACAVEDAGFHIRDCFMWLYTQSQPKAMSLQRFVDRMPMGEAEKAAIKSRLKHWKTPQLKSCFEPILVAQKPCDGTFLDNMLKHQTGLFNTEARIGAEMFPANVLVVEGVEETLNKYFLIPKPTAEERGSYNSHQTVKPLALCEYLIQLCTVAGAVVLDPFLGSGTTIVAARNLGRRYVGIDINPEYVEIAHRRLQELLLLLAADG